MIDSYKFGQIIVNGHTYRRDLIIFPGHVQADWWRAQGHQLAVADLEAVLAQPPEVLVVGTGTFGRVKVLAGTEEALAAQGVELVARPTKAACDRYNELLAAGRHVVAALHLTC